ncbi:hypothetical protein CVS42_08035 [Aeromonas veronii]|nr:hypothetical protein CVS42_08035 [Aeromonas veronii]
MKSILFHFRHHIGMFYALSMGLLGTVILPLIGLVFFELSKFQIIPFYAKGVLVDIGAVIAVMSYPIAIVIMLIFRHKYIRLQHELARY